MAESPFRAVRDHVLLPWASRLEEVDPPLRALLSVELFEEIVARIPDDWLPPDPGYPTPADQRAGYVRFLARRLAAASTFLTEAVRARAQLV
jgi:hypothetical protein